MSVRIVVGIDASTHSTAALRWAMRYAAAQHDAEVIAVLAWQLPMVSNPAAFDRDELQRAYEEVLTETVAEALPSPDLPVYTRVVLGDPIDVLVNASRDAQLLVIGSRGRSPFTGLILGSVSQACAARAACPVVVVRHPDAEHDQDGASAPAYAGANLRTLLTPKSE
jgi:nucleotide-binding universal stress UspA family protein